MTCSRRQVTKIIWYFGFVVIDLKKIKSLGVCPDLIEFTEFLIEEKGERTFPDYQKLNLMNVPGLVPHLWVFDFRNGMDDGLLFHFSGTKIDSHYGYNITSHIMEDCYNWNYPDELIDGCYRQVYLQKKIGHTSREVNMRPTKM